MEIKSGIILGFFLTFVQISFSGPAPLVPVAELLQWQGRQGNSSLLQERSECSELRVTLTSKQSKLQIPKDCPDYGFIPGEADCGGATTYPMTCTFKMKHQPKDENHMFLEEQEPKPKPESVGQIYSLLQLSGKTVGKHDAQYAWAAKAMAKATLAGDKCKPATKGRAYRNVDCDACWALFIPHPCNCNCRGWVDALGLPGLCNEPCTGEWRDYDGSYCHKPCDRYHQLALRTGCGFFHDRVCVKDTGSCLARWVNRAWSLVDILIAIGTSGAGKSMKAAVELTAEIGLKATMKLLKSAMKEAAQALVKKVKDLGFIKDSMRGKNKDLNERILENGAVMLLTTSIPTDWGAAAWEIAAAVDPTGVVGFIKDFIPPDDCDQTAYMDDPYPADADGPDWDALEADRSENSWHLAPAGLRQCDTGVSAEQSKCQSASDTLLKIMGKSAGRSLQVGSAAGCSSGWGHVPKGCSMQSGGDFAPHYNSNSGSTCPHSAYQLICSNPGYIKHANKIPAYWSCRASSTAYNSLIAAKLACDAMYTCLAVFESQNNWNLKSGSYSSGKYYLIAHALCTGCGHSSSGGNFYYKQSYTKSHVRSVLKIVTVTSTTCTEA
jgi:hypothetical protein